MEAIRTYIDNVFKAFEESAKVVTLKRDMSASMEEKYLALKADGKSEHEAVGSVIADFGNIDEIAAEMGIRTVGDGTFPKKSENVLYVSREEAFDLIGQFKKSGKWIGIGVWIVLAGIGSFMLLGDMGFNNSEAFGLFSMLTFIAAAVVLFIIYGMALAQYEKFEEANIELDTSTRAELEAQRKAYTPTFITHIASGVAIILLGIGFFLLMGASFENFEGLSIALLLLTIGGAVFLFVKSSMIIGAYEILFEEDEYSRKYKSVVNEAIDGMNNSERIIGTVAAVFWPVMTAVYLLWSFLADAWHISWLIWPIAGILFGAFAGGISVWNEGRRK
jgi:hypothetical protein